MQKQCAPADDGFPQTIKSPNVQTPRTLDKIQARKNKNAVRPIGDDGPGGCLHRLSTPVAVSLVLLLLPSDCSPFCCRVFSLLLEEQQCYKAFFSGPCVSFLASDL